MKALLAALALLSYSPALAAAALPAPPRFEVGLDRDSITVGDPVTVTARLLAPGAPLADAPVTLANVGDSWGRAAVLEPPRLERVGAPGARQLVWTFRITAFAPGRIDLPPLEARFDLDPPRSERAAEPLALEVRSVLAAEGDDLKPAPPAPPRPLPLPAAFWAAAAALALALAAAALALARRRAAAATAAMPAPPPLAELEAALATLAGEEMVAGHRRLSSALRRYLGRRLAFPALEWTTTEIARRLGASGLDPALPLRVRRLLAACDGVKFARRPAAPAELEARRDEAGALARELESALAPPAPPGSAA